MNRKSSDPRSIVAALLAFAVLAVLPGGCSGDGATTADAFPGPWGADIVTPADLVKELAGASKPAVVCVAPPFMYRTGHVPGAILHGPATAPSALSELTAWAQSLPQGTSIVVYCGCCPVDHCPNLRPAWAALKNLGLAHVRVLALPNNFGADWVDRGYAVER